MNIICQKTGNSSVYLEVHTIRNSKKRINMKIHNVEVLQRMQPIAFTYRTTTIISCSVILLSSDIS